MIRAALGRRAMDGMSLSSRSIISNGRHHHRLIRSSLGLATSSSSSTYRFLSIKALDNLNNNHNNNSSNINHQRTRYDILSYSSSSSSLLHSPYPPSSTSLHPPHHLYPYPLTTTKRTYIFLPALSDISKSILSTLPPWLTTNNNNNSTTTTTNEKKIKLVIRLRQTRQYLLSSAQLLRRQKTTTHKFRQWRDDLRRRTTAKYRRLLSSSVGRRLTMNNTTTPETWFDAAKMLRSNGRRRWRSWAREGRRMRAGVWRRWHQRNNNNLGKTTTSVVPAKETMVVVIDEPAERAWFDSEGYPLTSRDETTGRFVNPWNSESSNGVHEWRDVMKWKWQRWQNKRRSRSVETTTDGSDDESPLATLASLERDDDDGGRTIDGVTSSSTAIAAVNPSSSSSDDEVNLTWIGHSTCLVKMNSFTLLTDPIFSSYIGPLPTTRLLGVDREIPPALSLPDIPSKCLDVVLISHDHYDHLDVDSVRALNESGRVRYWCVPLGIKDWLMEVGDVREEDVVEMEWWDEAVFERVETDDAVREGGELRFVGLRQRRQHGDGGQDRQGREFDDNSVTRRRDDDDDIIVNEGDSLSSSLSPTSTLTVTCAPSHHWCCRTPFDRNSRLWCSYAVKTTTTTTQQQHPTSFDDITTTTTTTTTTDNPNNNKRKTLNFYFAGDTALPPTFPLHRQIGHRLGPFDLVALPIGAYAPSFFMRDSHCDPKESVIIHRELKSRRSVAIHWGTFPMAEEPFFEPPKLLKDEAMKAGLNDGEFVAIRHGDTISSSSLNDEEDAGRHRHGDIDDATKSERYYNINDVNDDNGLREERQNRCYG